MGEDEAWLRHHERRQAEQRERREAGGRRLHARRPPDLVIFVFGMALASLAAAAATMWSSDRFCWRASDEVVERRVRVFNREIADRFYGMACQQLTRRARRRYAALSEGRCAHGLRAAAEQGTLRRSPVQMSSVNLLRSRATVETREHLHELTKPRTGECYDWRIDSVTSRAR